MTAPAQRRVPSATTVITVLLLVSAVAALGVVLLWLLPPLLTRHPSYGMSPGERLKAANDVRAPLIGFAVLVGSAVTLLFTARTYRLGARGQITERYTRAVGQLGDPQMPVRVGSVYALARLGADSPADRETIIVVLGAFIRERSKPLRDRQGVAPEDVQAAIDAAGRLLPGTATVLDLAGVDLRNTDLSAIPRRQVRTQGAKLDGAKPPS